MKIHVPQSRQFSYIYVAEEFYNTHSHEEVMCTKAFQPAVKIQGLPILRKAVVTASARAHQAEGGTPNTRPCIHSEK